MITPCAVGRRYKRRHPSVRSVEERNKLVLANLRLVGALVKLIVGDCKQDRYADLLQTGYVALIRAADLWNPARGVKFNSYAGNAIRQAFTKFLRADSVFRCPDHVYSKPNLATAWKEKHQREGLNKFEETLIDACSEDPSQLGYCSPRWWVERLARKACLSNRERKVLRLRLDGLLFEAIGARLGVSASRVKQNLRQAMDRIRQAGLPEWSEVVGGGV